MATDALLVTCEHGGNRIPAAFRRMFRGQRALLDSHRGYDAGALVMARDLAKACNAPLVASTVSRLLVDLNRSVRHPRIFSAATCAAPKEIRETIIERHYRPYRDRVEQLVEEWVSRGRRVIHISSHSFTPRLDGNVRRADIGLLYDPHRRGELELCARWKISLAEVSPLLRVRRNYPYAGKGDGLTAYLRKRFSPAAYVGVELEISQAIVHGTGRRWVAVRGAVIDSLRAAFSTEPFRVTATRGANSRRP